MLGRFGVGLVKGLLVGLLVLAGLVFGLKMLAVPLWAAYLLAMVGGVLTGLIAGRPIWQREARIEAGLKAAAGMVLGGIGFFALNHWGHALFVPELLSKMPGVPAVPATSLVPGNVSLAFLPVVTTVLGLFFELDNTPVPDEKKSEAGAAPAPNSRARVSSEVPSAEETDEVIDTTAPPQQRRNKR